jgi:hypothetical protein
MSRAAEALCPAKPKRKPAVAKVRFINAASQIAMSPDDDVVGWRNRLKEIFATSSPLFVEASLKQLMAASRLPGMMLPTTPSLSAALEIVASLEPENEAQAALAIHVACLHAASLNVLSRMQNVTDRNVIAMATAAAKLERAYHGAIETYSRLKHGVRQVIRIEKVEIQSGAQAVIGLLNNKSAGG